MPDTVKEQLRQAYELIKARKRQEAVALLLPILQADEGNADAWWLLANSLNEPNDVREALDNVLRLNPAHDKAQTMLTAIDARYPRPAPAPEPEPDTFGLGDSASDPFAGFAAEPAAEVDSFYEADEPAAPAEDPFAAASADLFGAAEPAEAPGAFGGAPEPFGGSTEVFGGPAEPFGSALGSVPADEDPFALPPSLSKVEAEADPFGDPFAESVPAAPRSKASRPAAARPSGAKPAQRRAAPAAKKDPFAEDVAAPRQRSAAPKSGGTNPLVLLLAVIGGISLVVCVACGGLAAIAPTVLGNIGIQALNQIDTSGFALTLEAIDTSGFVATLEAAGTSLEGLVPDAANALARGSISYGEKKRDTLNAGEQHAWTLNAEANVRVAITMTSTANDGLDAFLTLVDPAGNTVASNDDYTDGLNAQFEYQFPGGGTYTIIASSFPGTYGQYELKVERR